jgi:hypothetical protein
MPKPHLQSAAACLLVLSAIYAAPAGASTCSQDAAVWKQSIQGKKRFIPIELWAGVQWDGRKELAMPSVDAEYSHINKPNSKYRITGPNPWLHPVLEKTFLVYERINPEKNGIKFQRFTKNRNSTGLGRIYDSRPKNSSSAEIERDYLSGGLKFPIGYWQEGEEKHLRLDELDIAEPHTKTAEILESIILKRIDSTFPGVNNNVHKHCVEFRWKKINLSVVKTRDHQTYTYCPCMSMVDVIDHMK